LFCNGLLIFSHKAYASGPHYSPHFPWLIAFGPFAAASGHPHPRTGTSQLEETLRAASKPCEFGDGFGASGAAVHVLTLYVFALGWPDLPVRAPRKSTSSFQLTRSMTALSLG
jgi:hypothetical protein